MYLARSIYLGRRISRPPRWSLTEAQQLSSADPSGTIWTQPERQVRSTTFILTNHLFWSSKGLQITLYLFCKANALSTQWKKQARHSIFTLWSAVDTTLISG